MRAIAMRRLLETIGIAVVAVAMAGDPHHSVAGEATPSSAWLRLDGRPSSRGAVGVLVNDAGPDTSFHVIWADGSFSDEKESTLVASPEPDILPTVSPATWAAVFDVSNGMALVAGRRGWGWVTIQDGNVGSVLMFEPRLDQMAKSMEREVSEAAGLKGYSLHFPNLIILEAQTLRREPSERAAATRSVTEAPILSCEGAGTLHKVLDTPPDIKQARYRPSPIRVVERKGDWGRVVLPKPGIPWYACFDKAAIAWEEQPAGWARLAKAGPVPGTKIRLWRIMAWGAWP